MCERIKHTQQCRAAQWTPSSTELTKIQAKFMKTRSLEQVTESYVKHIVYHDLNYSVS